MRRQAPKIDRCSIDRANHYARSHVSYILERAKVYAEDPNREERLAKSECIVCHGGSRIGGSVCTQAPCPLCGTQVSSGNACIDVLCISCAKANGLCKHCGADIDLKQRRKPRPYESQPPPPQCVNPECKQPIRQDAEVCCSCGKFQHEPTNSTT